MPSLQAIEAFALMVKTTAQTLQAFGTELAETELPNDAEATTNLLQAHTLKKEKMKVSCSSITSIHIKWHINILYYDYIFFFIFKLNTPFECILRQFLVFQCLHF